MGRLISPNRSVALKTNTGASNYYRMNEPRQPKKKFVSFLLKVQIRSDHWRSRGGQMMMMPQSLRLLWNSNAFDEKLVFSYVAQSVERKIVFP